MRVYHDSELPDPSGRWTVRRKAAVVQAVRSGLLTRTRACDRYQLSPEELAAWERNFDQHGLFGLRATQAGRTRKQR
ncbi:MAG: DUF1153 domain-containing protein [Alphaproteobacteria bacterium]|nr:DUF1153 domain-containing protein [Alphaproteobacteria bacterium]